jgi:antitoxin component of MazEF toxin-antitoxin module
MIKKTKKNHAIILKINKKIADALGINKKSDVKMIMVNDTLIIKSKNKKTQSSAKRKAKLQAITNQLMDKYEPVLKKLAKT